MARKNHWLGLLSVFSIVLLAACSGGGGGGGGNDDDDVTDDDDDDDTAGCDISSCPAGQHLVNAGDPGCYCEDDDPQCELTEEDCGPGEILYYAGSDQCACVLTSCPITSCPAGTVISDPADTECECLDWADLAYTQALSRLDRDGDGVAGVDDLAALEACLTGAQTADCDLNGDGAYDEADMEVALTMIGQSIANSAALIATIATDFAKMAAGELDFLNNLPMMPDYDGDGDVDHDDVTVYANLLSDDPVGKHDQNGDGQLDNRDAWLYAKELEGAYFGGPAPLDDINGDGQRDDDDLMALAGMAISTATIQAGYLDNNMDGQVDLEDYCPAASHPLQQNFYGLLMPSAAATAAHAAALPVIAFCRADGRMVHRNYVRIDSDVDVMIQPSNLYLQKVNVVPEDYAPLNLDEIAPGSPMYIITSEATNQAVRGIAMPLRLENDAVRGIAFDFAGPDLESNAVLLTPQAALDLSDAAVRGRHMKGRVAARTVGLSKPIWEMLLEEGERAAIDEFLEKLQEVADKADAFTNGCPCTLSASARGEWVRFLVRLSNCLATVKTTAEGILRLQQNDHRGITRSHIAASSNASMAWVELSGMIELMAVVDAWVLVLETEYTAVTEGVHKAFIDAAGNLITEIINDSMSSDDFLEDKRNMTATATSGLVANGVVGGVAGQIKASVPGDLNAWLNGRSPTQALTDSFNEAMRNNSNLSPKDALKNALDGLKNNIGGLIKNGFTSAVKAFIKNIPKMVVQYYKDYAFDAYYNSVAMANAYFNSTLNIGGWQAVVRELGAAQATVDGLLSDMLNKFAADGCTMSVATSDPCRADLSTKVNEAADTLRNELSAADSALNSTLNGLSESSFNGSCLGGEAKRDLDRANQQVIQASRVVNAYAGGDPNQLSDLHRELNDAIEARQQAQERYASSCVGDILSGVGIDLDQAAAFKTHQDALDAAVDKYRNAVKAALDAYQLCASGNGGSDSCSPNLTNVLTNPWGTAQGCMDCVPDIPFTCCGNAVVEFGETCDYLATPNGCGSGITCKNDCTCDMPFTCPDDMFTAHLTFGVFSDPFGHICCGGVPIGSPVEMWFNPSGSSFYNDSIPMYDIAYTSGSMSLVGGGTSCDFFGTGTTTFAGFPNSPATWEMSLFPDGTLTGFYEVTPSGFPGQPIIYDTSGFMTVP